LSLFVEMLLSDALQRLRDGKPTDDLPYWAVNEAANVLEAEERRAKRGTPSAKKKFRSSLAWRRCRYAVLAANIRKYGKATCEVCKSTTGPFHVDHELPISTPEGWERRFVVSVLRCTCEACNTGRLASPISLERGPAAAE
jgi:hypothetical protein